MQNSWNVIAQNDTTVANNSPIILSRVRRIVGAKDESNKFKYQVSIQHQGLLTGSFRHFCGGSIIGDNLILTAAHCVYVNDQVKDVKKLKVLAGTNVIDADKGITSNVEIIYWNKNYPEKKSHDIAVIKV